MTGNAMTENAAITQHVAPQGTSRARSPMLAKANRPQTSAAIQSTNDQTQEKDK